MSRSDPRKPSLGILVEVFMTCSHYTFFRNKIKPKQGEIIWCSKCGTYKAVT